MASRQRIMAWPARAWLAVAAGAWFLGGIPAFAAPLEAYGGLPTIDRLSLSGDGTRIAYVSSGGDGESLQIRRAGDLALIGKVNIGTQKLVSLQWADRDHLILVIETTAKMDRLQTTHQRRWWQPSLLDVSNGRMTDLLASDWRPDGLDTTEALDTVSDLPQPRTVDGRVQIFLPGYSLPAGTDRYVTTMFRRGLAAGTATTLATGTVATDWMLADTAGHLTAREDYDTESGRWALWLRPATAWRKIGEEVARLDPPSLEGLGPDGRSVIVSKLEDGRIRYHAVSIGDGLWSQPIAELDETEPVSDPARQTIWGGLDSGRLRMRYAFLDQADRRRWAQVEGMFPGETVEWIGWSDDHARILAHVAGTRSGDAFYLVDLDAARAVRIGDEYGGIGRDDYYEVRGLAYPAGDGRTIHAFMIFPKGVAPHNMPLVVLVHGGPSAHDKPGFDWWAQALASLGYAVLQPQFRGSDGFGHDFVEAGYGEWGRKMQTDLSDGVRALVGQGIVDPARVCIVGGSYGGYAAMAGVTLQSGVYRCAVAVSGVSDLRRLLRQAESDSGPRSGTIRYLQRFMGAVSAADPALDALSPARHADRLSAPLLLIHGEIDTIVQPEQSRLMDDAARRAGKPVELVTLKGEDHNLSRGSTRLEMLRATADFLRANLPTGAAGEAHSPGRGIASPSSSAR